MHTLFALFDTSRDAIDATKELALLGTEGHRCSIVFHTRTLEGAPASETPLFETGAASGAARFAVLGSIIGAALGTLLIGPAGLIGAGPLAAMLFGAATGTAGGALTGAIAGSSDLDPELKKLSVEVERGKVLLAVEPPSLATMSDAEQVLNRHHAHVVRRHLLWPMTTKEENMNLHS
jgi:hypothetical protein